MQARSLDRPLPLPNRSARGPSWSVYVLLSASGRRTYVGITTDPARRLAQHNGERAGGARSTRAGRPWTLGAVHGPYGSRGEAQRVERALRQLPRDGRLRWRSG